MSALRMHRRDEPMARRAAPRRIHRSTVTLRGATAADAVAIHGLIAEHVADGHLLPRTREEIAAHASRFIVVEGATRRSGSSAASEEPRSAARIIGCADIAPLSAAVGEVRSLVIGEQARGLGIGRALIRQLVDRATASGFRTLCAFTSAPGFFVQMGFSIVPHGWIPEKIRVDCAACPRFRGCGQYAVLLTLGPTCHR